MWGKGKELCGEKDLKYFRRGFSWKESFQIVQIPSPLDLPNPKEDNSNPDLSCHFDAVVEAVLSPGCGLGNLGF